VIKGVPIPLVVAVEQRRSASAYRFDMDIGTFVEYPQDDPDDPIADDYGMFLRVLWPRHATEEI